MLSKFVLGLLFINYKCQPPKPPLIELNLGKDVGNLANKLFIGIFLYEYNLNSFSSTTRAKWKHKFWIEQLTQTKMFVSQVNSVKIQILHVCYVVN